MKNEEELTLEELQKQLEELKEENEQLKEQLEAPPAVEVEEVEETDPVVEELEEEPETVEEVLEEAPADNDKETALQTRLEALWKREIQAELKEQGLQKFVNFINVEVDDSDGLQAKVKELKALLEDYEVEDTYQPTNHTNTDAYSLAKAKKDPKAMLKARLG